MRARRPQFRQRTRRYAAHLRKIQGLRSADREAGLGNQARDQECPRGRVRRRRDDPRIEGTSVRGPAGRGVHLERDHGQQAFRSRLVLQHHQCGVSYIAQRPGARVAGEAEPRRLLGRAFDPARRIRLHQEGRLRNRASRHGCVHRLRTRRHERSDEGSHHRPFQATHHQRALLGHKRTRHHRGRTAQSHREPARHHAGHRKAPGGFRTSRSWDRRVPGRRRHRRGDLVSAQASCSTP